MLIRGVDPDLKRRIEESARKHGRSLSQEAMSLMRKALVTPPEATGRAGAYLRSLVGNAFFTEEELALIASSRKEHDREPPDLN